MLAYQTVKSRFKTAYGRMKNVRYLQVAIVGGGPAGFYTASQLLKSSHVKVDMYEQLPVPFGLVRYGVAPDHPEVKNVISKFTSVAELSRFNFMGNVTVGTDISLDSLKSAYDAVVLSYGSTGEHKLGIEGKIGPSSNLFTSQEFVGWYNGHPKHANLKVDLSSTDTAIVVGQGNVALDVARILLSPIDKLAQTDITQHAIEVLSSSRIRHVHVVGRRGPVHVSFTSKEFRELVALCNTYLELDHTWLETQLTLYADVLRTDRARRRLMELLVNASKKKPITTDRESDKKQVFLDFLLSPYTLLTHPETNTVTGIEFQKNTLVGKGLDQRAVGLDTFHQIPAGLVVSSIGFKNEPFMGSPFDSKQRIIPNIRGRVKDEHALYSSGWIKTGPKGVIASTMYDAYETAERIRTTTFQDWLKLDDIEITRGHLASKKREKIVTVDDMFSALLKIS
ncbi:hypothetical protein BATDEDRAFT_26930 [Batrachochytrium dendrobatidis JAM81]|uniref:NADPH:adrenodoxin oxidoreductase, mitochondrial n=1 Tax=Batrachochytrium dendrobatidis (strain JAM81 / FGSC 10211) TaxID=684364 RepID=F4P9K1_BATDJ|nr:NADPH-adrenodoxin reductase [Batrachochytrium dendrobatidis JAM81]EGF78333.1 hypothetical protein BATDEDRAFT_26930 [Batrachochytrium dendrobatidis JAM81]|eukprot:XP_006681093.1 hypothetical protein BATDEDRAFT_26930 [Batrachochytrium dendrobatidis JAM81]